MSRATLALVDSTTRRRIVALAQTSASSREIADTVGVSVHAVSRVRRQAGLAAPRGRPATGQRPKVWLTIDQDVDEALADEATRTESTPAAVAATVLTDWARARPKRRSSKK